MPSSCSFIPLFAIFFFLSDCESVYQPAFIEYDDYHIAGKQSPDKGIHQLMKPCDGSVPKKRNDVIDITGEGPEKKQRGKNGVMR
jgi:hypothetical protein